MAASPFPIFKPITSGNRHSFLKKIVLDIRKTLAEIDLTSEDLQNSEIELNMIKEVQGV